MANSSGNSADITISRALELVRTTEMANVPPAAVVALDEAITALWSRIQANPNTYVMSKEEFGVFNYFRTRFIDSDVAKSAVARYWNSFQDDATDLDGIGST